MRNVPKRPLSTLALFAASGMSVHAQSPPLPSSPRVSCPAVATAGPDVEAVRQRELRGARVNVEGWQVDEAMGFFAPEFVSIEPGGGVDRLEKALASFHDGRNAGFARNFDVVALEIRVYGCDSAVVVGTADVGIRTASPEASPWRIRFLNMWRRDGGNWLLAANQFTRVAVERGSSASPDGKPAR